MGCCQSSPRSPPSSPYHSSPVGPRPLDIAPNDRTVSRSPLIIPRHSSGTPQTTTISSSGALPSATPLTTTPNTPLRLPTTWTSKKQTWTRSALTRERAEFFDTCTSGASEVWGVVRLVVEALRAGDVGSAQGLLDASGCTCPTGDVSQGVFDERGQLYGVPQWILCDPKNVVEDTTGEEGVESEVDDAKKDEKGKGKEVGVKDGVKVKCRLSDRGTDVVVVVEKEGNVKSLARRIQEEAGLSSETKVKVAYLGKVLKESQSLAAQGWQQGHVVNALVFE